MNIEEVKELHKVWYSDGTDCIQRKHIDWLIAEVTKKQQYIDEIVTYGMHKKSFDGAQKLAAKKCAEIVRTFSEDHKTIQPSFIGIVDAIRKEFNI